MSYYKEPAEAPSTTSSPSSRSRLSTDDELPKIRAGNNTQNGGATRSSLVQYVIIALLWGLLASQTLALMTRPVGTVCPAKYAWLIPAGQVLMLVLDTLVIVQVAKTQRFSIGNSSMGSTSTNTSTDSWVSLGILSLSSALVLTVVAIGIYPGHLFGWAPAVERLVLRDLVCESIVAAAMLIAAVSLLSSTHPATLAAITGAVGILVHYVKQVKDERAVIWATAHSGWREARYLSVLAIVFSYLLVRSEGGLPNSPHHRNPASRARQRWVTVLYLGFLLALLANQPSSGNTATVAFGVIDHAQRASRMWTHNAAQSRSLPEAVAEYKARYGVSPPPHFDKWYNFAVERNSPIIDTFDQIHGDLLPFWGIPPAKLREETTRLVEQTHLGIGGFRVKGHAVELSHITPGSHFWMMEGFRAMVEPFLEWLPDMDLAFNLDDECRVVVPFDEMQRLTVSALEARKRVVPIHGDNPGSFSTALTPPWSDDFLADGFKEAHGKDEVHPAFSIRSPYHSVFDMFIAPTCPPSSPALTSRWWSRRESLPSGRGMVTDPVAALDLCQRPDIAQMHGFLLQPGAFGVSRTLLPIFSQGRIPGFNDILVPSPWNFMTKVDIDDAVDNSLPWSAKTNSVFWRGSSSDGVGRNGDWTAFLRTRFAWIARLTSSSTGTITGEAAKESPSPDDNDHLTINVSFVGKFATKCDRPNCRAQTLAFYGAPEVENPPGGMDFQEHWAHRHLVDLDGAGFSGRFIPFLKSRSLVYRVSLFRTWYDERVHAWQHYVPLDVSLGLDLWGLFEMLVGVEERSGETETSTEDTGYDNAGGYNANGQPMSAGEKIALGGREWARKALRKEDMQVYMFRLLLEWARLIDDRREELGFVI